jgi:hypothetical protein
MALQDEAFKNMMSGITRKAGLNCGMSFDDIVVELRLHSIIELWLVLHEGPFILPDMLVIVDYKIVPLGQTGLADYHLVTSLDKSVFLSARSISRDNYIVFPKELNLSRAFLSRQERDEYFDNVKYLVDLRNEQYRR